MPAPHETLTAQKQIMTLLAREAQVPVSYVEMLYEHERTELADSAHITTFLHIFATRNVKEILRRRGLIDQSPLPAVSPLMAQ